MIKSIRNKIMHLLVIFVSIFLPKISFADFVCSVGPSRRDFSEIVCEIVSILYSTVPLIIGLCVMVFLWGLARFVFRVGGDEGAIEEGKHIMFWGVIGLFVATSIYGIIQFLYSDFVGGTLNIPPRLPTF